MMDEWKREFFPETEWMGEDEIKDKFYVGPADATPNNIIGYLNGRLDDVIAYKDDFEDEIKNMNKISFCSYRSKKIFSNSLTESIREIRRGESLLLFDPMGDLRKVLQPLAEKEGYQICVFNVSDPKNSNSCNPFAHLVGEPEEVVAQNAYAMAKVIVANSNISEEYVDVVKTVMQGAILYFTFDTTKDSEKCTLPMIYDFVKRSKDVIEDDIERLPIGHPTRNVFQTVLGQEEKVVTRTLEESKKCLNILKEVPYRELLSAHDMDFSSLDEEKCMYIIIQHSSDKEVNYLAPLIYEAAYQVMHEKLMQNANMNDRLKRRVNIRIEETENPLIYPDLWAQLKIMRNTNCMFSISIDSLAQLKRIYPDRYEQILAGCGIHEFIGNVKINEDPEYWKKQLGEMKSTSRRNYRVPGVRRTELENVSREDRHVFVEHMKPIKCISYMCFGNEEYGALEEAWRKEYSPNELAADITL